MKNISVKRMVADVEKQDKCFDRFLNGWLEEKQQNFYAIVLAGMVEGHKTQLMDKVRQLYATQPSKRINSIARYEPTKSNSIRRRHKKHG